MALVSVRRLPPSTLRDDAVARPIATSPARGARISPLVGRCPPPREGRHRPPLCEEAAMAMPPPLAGVVRLAAASRLLVLALSLLARLLFRPYDTSASLHPPCLRSPSPSLSSSLPPFTNFSAAISSLAVWDGVHFARAAECGYEYEQSFAFLPLLPASLALLARSRKHLLVNCQDVGLRDLTFVTFPCSVRAAGSCAGVQGRPRDLWLSSQQCRIRRRSGLLLQVIDVL